MALGERVNVDMNLEDLNQSLFLALNAAPGLTGWPLALAVAAARGAVGVLGILLLWRFYARPAERRALVAAAAAVVPALALNWLLGLVWPHPRPLIIGLGQLYLDHRPEPSFPSHHATLMWTLAVGLLWRWPARVTSWLAIALAALTSWARVFLGLHFPLDIAGSIAVAVATVAVLSSLRNVVEHHVAAPIERLSGVAAARWGRRTADRQPASGSAAMVPGKVRGRWCGWVWAAPATLALVLLGLVVAWHGGGIASTARWPEQQTAFLALNAVLGKVPAPLWSAVTLLGDSSVLMLLLALFLLGRPQVFAAVLASVPAGALFSGLLKHWADVPRPAAVLDHASFHLIGPALHHNSFPSGHTVSAFAAAAAVLATLAPSPRRGREWVLLVAGLMVAVVVALSRVAVGAHWLLDLVAGASGGWLAGLSGAALARHAGWWRWLFFGAGRRATSVGLIVWGLLVWFRPHDTLTGAAVLGLAGLCGIAAGLGLLLTGRSVSALPVPLATGSSAPDASVDETADQVAQQPDQRTS